jgi:hypothetical protein
MAESLLFQLDDEQRFKRLKVLVDALAEAKAADEFRDDDYWESFLDDDARSAFWWPTEAEIADWSERWFSTPVEERLQRKDLWGPWTFDSLVEAVRNGDYRLVGCSRTSDGQGAISFEPMGYPYGGTGWMRAAVEAFGGSVTLDPSA